MTPLDLVASIRSMFPFIVGVPDSSLAELSPLWEGDSAVGRVCVNEGAAVAVAAGWAMGQGTCPLVFMQNSGLGNALNPLLSLANPSVLRTPMVLLVGLRGWPGDEPQHAAIGRSTSTLLKAADIPLATVDRRSELLTLLREARVAAAGRNGPAAVVVPRGVLTSSAPHRRADPPAVGWTSRDAVRLALTHGRHGSIVVSSTGYNTRYVDEFRRENPGLYPEHVYCVGGMGHESSVAQGLALARPRAHVLCVSGDGSALMHLGAVFQSLDLNNYTQVIVNNGRHESVGGGGTLAARVSFTSMLGSALWCTTALRGPATGTVIQSLAAALVAPGPSMVEMLVDEAVVEPPPRPVPPFARLEQTPS